MTIIANSITLHRKAKAGKPGADAVLYTIVPSQTVVPEGADSVSLAVNIIIGGNTYPLSYGQAVAEGIILVGEADAANHVEWNSNYQQLYLSSGFTYGHNYTILALRNGQRVASVTIGVTCPGAEGQRGQDGTSLVPNGTAIAYFSTFTDYYAAQKISGLYLVSGKTVGMRGVAGAYLYTYNAETGTTDIASPQAGESYINEPDGHLYMAVADPENPVPPLVTPTSPNGLMWRDAGQLRGVDAINISVEGENVVFPQTGAQQRIYIDVYRGAAKLDYAKEYTCSVLNPQSSNVLNGRVAWGFNISQGRFYYHLRVNAAYRGTDISGTIPFTVTVDGVQYQRNINVRTVLNGTNGYNGCLIRRTEWQAGKEYRNDSDFSSLDPLTNQYIIDEVTVSDEISGKDYAYIVTPAHRGRISGTTDEAGNIIKPGLPVLDGSWNYDTDNDYYTRLQFDAPIRVPFADIKQAIIDYLQARQIVITDDDGQPYGAFGGGQNNNWPLWFGGTTPDQSVTKINRQGVLHSQKFVTMGNGSHVEVENGLMKVFGADRQHPNIVFGVDEQGFAVLKYYDGDHLLYNLGPNGITQQVAETVNRWGHYISRIPISLVAECLPNSYAKDAADQSDNKYYLFFEGYKKVGSVMRYKIAKGAPTTQGADYSEPWEYKNSFFLGTTLLPYSNYYDGNFNDFGYYNGKPDTQLLLKGWCMTSYRLSSNPTIVEVEHYDDYGRMDDSMYLYLKKFGDTWYLCDANFNRVSYVTPSEYKALTGQ